MTTSTGHQGPFSEISPEDHTIILPAEPTAAPNNKPSSSSTDANPADAPPYSSSGEAEGKQWKPSINRQQSWSAQDMKHMLQERLLGIEKGKESGFTEASQRG
ncbi:hypothetical protein VTN00DRAFT_2060 [Thermoascus crustaceus]|uniref:uncharacterized protein n=1 Tax=Thermoascus crustaceus TaxID=5088 RepID=UPI003742E349